MFAWSHNKKKCSSQVEKTGKNLTTAKERIDPGIDRDWVGRSAI